LIGAYLPNLAHLTLWVALGDSEVSPHTRWVAANSAMTIFSATTPVPAVPADGALASDA
jgi:hypothetical protein